jgi:hypothetical protein
VSAGAEARTKKNHVQFHPVRQHLYLAWRKRIQAKYDAEIKKGLKGR